MKVAYFIVAAALTLASYGAAPAPSALNLAGNWEGAVMFGKFNFKLIMHVQTNAAGRIEVTLDMPDQGQKGLRADALLFNAPEVRLELDQFGTSYNGKVNSEFTQIDGEFEEGPGGRPEPLVFKRSTRAEEPEPERKYTFAEGEARDIRGYWKGEIAFGPGMKVLAGLKIGRIPDGSFRATVDLPEQGAKDIPASSVTSEKSKATMEWKMFQAKFEGALSDDGNELAGSWLQGGRTNAQAFSRLDAPFQLLPNNLSYTPDRDDPRDVRGFWKGTLVAAGNKLRLVLKVGRAPDGTYSGSLSSIDQGGGEIPMSAATYTAPDLKMEWKGIRGRYEGKVSGDGKMIEGTWEQFGNPMPLKLERTTEASATEKS